MPLTQETNILKKTSIDRIVIGEPYSPDSGNWIYVTIHYKTVNRKAGCIETTSTAQHRFRVTSFEEILPEVLRFSEVFQKITQPEKSHHDDVR